jgi:RNA polymerase sigma-70 factor (ECF subfamily)
MDSEEYIRIAEKYADVVYRATISYCKNKNDAEDAVQNTFLKLLKTDVQFNDEEHIRRWLISVSINECKNIWKSFWHRKVTSLEDLEQEPLYIESDRQELFSEIMRLPPKYRVVVHLYYYEGYSVKEIAKIVNISESNVQIRLMRARNKLKERLEDINE